MVQLDLTLGDLKVSDEKKSHIEQAIARLEALNVDLFDDEYFS